MGSSPTTWTYWDFVAGDFGFPTSDMDYPDLAYSDEFLYVSTDVFSSGRVVMRISLKDLQGGGTVSYSWTDPDDGTQCWGAHLVQQTGDRGMWAGQDDNSHLVFFTWPDNSGTYSWGNVTRRRLAERHAVVPGPGRQRLAEEARDFPAFAVTGGVQMANGRVALAWSASNGQANGPGHDFKQAHVRYVEIDPDTRTTKREIPIWNDDYAFAYPSLARAGDAVGITARLGRPIDHSNCAMGSWATTSSGTSTPRPGPRTGSGDYRPAETRPAPASSRHTPSGTRPHATDTSKIVYHPYFARFGLL